MLGGELVVVDCFLEQRRYVCWAFVKPRPSGPPPRPLRAVFGCASTAVAQGHRGHVLRRVRPLSIRTSTSRATSAGLVSKPGCAVWRRHFGTMRSASSNRRPPIRFRLRTGFSTCAAGGSPTWRKPTCGLWRAAPKRRGLGVHGVQRHLVLRHRRRVRLSRHRDVPEGRPGPGDPRQRRRRTLRELDGRAGGVDRRRWPSPRRRARTDLVHGLYAGTPSDPSDDFGLCCRHRSSFHAVGLSTTCSATSCSSHSRDLSSRPSSPSVRKSGQSGSRSGAVGLSACYQVELVARLARRRR
jgi:hypothetical protein